MNNATTIWLTGLPASGKTTYLKKYSQVCGTHCLIIDNFIKISGFGKKEETLLRKYSSKLEFFNYYEKIAIDILKLRLDQFILYSKRRLTIIECSPFLINYLNVTDPTIYIEIPYDKNLKRLQLKLGCSKYNADNLLQFYHSCLSSVDIKLDECLYINDNTQELYGLLRTYEKQYADHRPQ